MPRPPHTKEDWRNPDCEVLWGPGLARCLSPTDRTFPCACLATGSPGLGGDRRMLCGRRFIGCLDEFMTEEF